MANPCFQVLRSKLLMSLLTLFHSKPKSSPLKWYWLYPQNISRHEPLSPPLLSPQANCSHLLSGGLLWLPHWSPQSLLTARNDPLRIQVIPWRYFCSKSPQVSDGIRTKAMASQGHKQLSWSASCPWLCLLAKHSAPKVGALSKCLLNEWTY